MLNDEQVVKLLESATYKFAKTMPQWPHWYTLRQTWESSQDFESVVVFIRENGKTEKYMNKEYAYFYLNGYKYWTMGTSPNQTILINKAIA